MKYLWKWELADNGWADHICPFCGFKENTDIHVSLDWNFCPRCGHDMRKEQDENSNDISDRKIVIACKTLLDMCAKEENEVTYKNVYGDFEYWCTVKKVKLVKGRYPRK